MPKPKPAPALNAVLTALDKATRAALSPEDTKTIYAIGLQILAMRKKYEEQ
jgi:hypothetical protein